MRGPPVFQALTPKHDTKHGKRTREPGTTPEDNLKKTRTTSDSNSAGPSGTAPGAAGSRGPRAGRYSEVLKRINEPESRPLSFFIIPLDNYRHLDSFDFQHISDLFFEAQMKEEDSMTERLANVEHAFVDGGIRIDVADVGCVGWWRKFIPGIPALDASRSKYAFSANGHTPYAYLKTTCRSIPACSGTPALGFVEGLKRLNSAVLPKNAPIVAWSVGDGSVRGVPHVVMQLKLPHVLAERVLRHEPGLRIRLNILRFTPTAPGKDSLPDELKQLFKTDEPEAAAPSLDQQLPMDTDTEIVTSTPNTSTKDTANGDTQPNTETETIDQKIDALEQVIKSSNLDRRLEDLEEHDQDMNNETILTEPEKTVDTLLEEID